MSGSQKNANSSHEDVKLQSDVVIANLTKRDIRIDYIDASNKISSIVVEEMLEGNDRTKVILAGAGIESLINDLLLNKFKNHKNIISDSISMSGFMGSFAAKVKMIYMLGLITEEEYNELQKFVKLRNRFAHRLEKRTLADEKDHLNSYSLFKEHFLSDWNCQPGVFLFIFVFLTLKAYLEKAIRNCNAVCRLELPPLNIEK